MTQQYEFLHWYEDSLPTHERKTRGHFSTPSRLVEQILDACGYTPDKNLAHIRILDPACGSGNFLVEAARRLTLAGKQAGYSEHTISRQLQRNIWGFDPDPISCFLAEMQLHQLYNEQQLPEQHCPRFHIHQADGLAFPWEAEAGIDLFLANPPYLAAKNTDLSGYRSTHQRGQSDSYLLFLDLALQVVRPGGWLALVLPDPVLARANAAHERQRLLKETTVHYLWHLADVFNAYVGAVVLIAQKCPPPPQHAIIWKRERWLRRQPTSTTIDRMAGKAQHPAIHTISQTLLQRQPRAELRYLLSTIHGTLPEQLHQIHTSHLLQSKHLPKIDKDQRELITKPFPLANLGDIVSIRRGEELGKDSGLLRTTPPQEQEQQWYPLLRGGIDLQPFRYPSASHWINIDHITKPLSRYTQPKLLLVKSVGNLQATIDLKGHVVLQTLYILQLHQQRTGDLAGDYTKVAKPGDAADHKQSSNDDELYFLMALLNSHLLQHYIYVLYTAYKLVQPQIEQHVLASLPIPRSVSQQEKESIVNRARQLMDACSSVSGDVELQAQSRALYEEQEQMISSLYKKALHDASISYKMPQSIILSSATDEGVITRCRHQRAAPSAY